MIPTFDGLNNKNVFAFHVSTTFLWTHIPLSVGTLYFQQSIFTFYYKTGNFDKTWTVGNNLRKTMSDNPFAQSFPQANYGLWRKKSSLQKHPD